MIKLESELEHVKLQYKSIEGKNKVLQKMMLEDPQRPRRCKNCGDYPLLHMGYSIQWQTGVTCKIECPTCGLYYETCRKDWVLWNWYNMSVHDLKTEMCRNIFWDVLEECGDMELVGKEHKRRYDIIWSM